MLLCATSMSYVLCTDPLEVTGMTEMSDVPSKIGSWFAKSTTCVTPLLESVLDLAIAALLNFYFLSMMSA